MAEQERLEEYERLAGAYPDFAPACPKCSSIDVTLNIMFPHSKPTICNNCDHHGIGDDFLGRMDYMALILDLQKAILELVEWVRDDK